VTHLNNQNQIDPTHALGSFTVIFVIITLLIVFSTKRKPASDQAFLAWDTSVALRGIAILLLIFGHLAMKCIEGTFFFEYAGRWAVIIFLYVSGVVLAKTYGLAPLDKFFLRKRFKRLAVTVWLALGIYYSLDYWIFHQSYSLKQRVANILGIINPTRPSEAAWFITYIVFLYLIYFLTSKIKKGRFFKIIILFSASYLSAFWIWHSPYLNTHFGIWNQYACVFPGSVLIGTYRVKIRRVLDKLLDHPIAYALITAFFLYLYFSKTGVYRVVGFVDAAIFSQIIFTLEPMPFIMALSMISNLIDKMPCRSTMLNQLGRYSFEIFLMHFPFMVYYDFFLFRKPLYFFFFVYFIFVIVLSMVIKKISDRINSLLFSKWSVPAHFSVRSRN